MSTPTYPTETQTPRGTNPRREGGTGQAQDTTPAQEIQAQPCAVCTAPMPISRRAATCADCSAMILQAEDKNEGATARIADTLALYWRALAEGEEPCWCGCHLRPRRMEARAGVEYGYL